jgi:hypothetical protein
MKLTVFHYQIGVVKGWALSDLTKYVTVSIPRAIAQKIDFLIEELGYWPSRSAFVREACLEKIGVEERRLSDLRGLEFDGPIHAGWKAPPGD